MMIINFGNTTMYNITTKLVMLFLIGTVISSCATTKGPPSAVGPMETLTTNLLWQLRDDQIKDGEVNGNNLTKTKIIWKPFVWMSTAELIKVKENSKIFQKIIQDVASEDSFKDFSVAMMSQKNLAEADYILSGAIENVQNSEDSYQVYGNVVDRHKKELVAKSDVIIASKLILLEKMALEKKRFLYVKQKEVDYLQLIMKEYQIGTKVKDRNEELNAKMLDAIVAYETGNSIKSYDLSKQVTEHPDGQTLTNYEIKYISSGQEDVKSRDIAISNFIHNGESIELKMYFKPNSNIIDNEHEDYKSWLCSIGKQTSRNNKCLAIYGHSSKSGEEQYNQALSSRRARAVQEFIWKDCNLPYFSSKRENQKFTLVGYSSEYCKVCTKEDSEENQRDRRIEIKINDC